QPSDRSGERSGGAAARRPAVLRRYRAPPAREDRLSCHTPTTTTRATPGSGKWFSSPIGPAAGPNGAIDRARLRPAVRRSSYRGLHGLIDELPVPHFQDQERPKVVAVVAGIVGLMQAHQIFQKLAAEIPAPERSRGKQHVAGELP